MEYEAFRTLVVRPGGLFLGKYEEEKEEWLRQLWDRARGLVREHPPAGRGAVRRQLKRLRQLADIHPWAGATGTTDRAVYLAMLGIADQIVGTTISPGQRRLAEIVNVESKTINHSVRRLIAAGLIVKVGVDADHDTSEYSLLPGLKSGLVTTSIPTMGGIDVDGVIHPDFGVEVPKAFNRTIPGLHRAAWDTYMAMPAGQWVTVQEVIARRTVATTAETVLQHLKVLHSLPIPLVDRFGVRGHRWMARVVSQADLDSIARALNITDAREIRRLDRHVADRDNWRLVRAARHNPANERRVGYWGIQEGVSNAPPQEALCAILSPTSPDHSRVW